MILLIIFFLINFSIDFSNLNLNLNLNLNDIIYFINENNDINLNNQVTITKEAGKAISQGLQVIGSNLGLAATITGIAGAVSKTIAKTSIPPLQKAGIVVGSSALMGLFHSKLAIANRRSILENTLNNIEDNKTDIMKESIMSNNFLGNDITNNPLVDMLENIQLTNYVFLSMLFILTIQ